MKTLENTCHVSDILFPFVFSIVICTFNIAVCLFLRSLVGTMQLLQKGNFLSEETFSFVIPFLTLFVLDCFVK